MRLLADTLGREIAPPPAGRWLAGRLRAAIGPSRRTLWHRAIGPVLRRRRFPRSHHPSPPARLPVGEVATKAAAPSPERAKFPKAILRSFEGAREPPTDGVGAAPARKSQSSRCEARTIALRPERMTALAHGERALLPPSSHLHRRPPAAKGGGTARLEPTPCQGRDFPGISGGPVT